MTVRGGKTAKGAEFSRTAENKKERENRGEGKTILVLLASIHFLPLSTGD